MFGFITKKYLEPKLKPLRYQDYINQQQNNELKSKVDFLEVNLEVINEKNIKKIASLEAEVKVLRKAYINIKKKKSTRNRDRVEKRVKAMARTA